MEYMVPSGYMGDAMTENNGAAILDTGFNQGCRQGSPSCIKIEYKPADGKVGWAAFAWQRVIDGSDNWGQSPGAGSRIQLGYFPRFSSSRGAMSLQNTRQTGHRMRWLD
jgi:hypothetical protein